MKLCGHEFKSKTLGVAGILEQFALETLTYAGVYIWWGGQLKLRTPYFFAAFPSQ
jgi:hypothetical protein